MRNMKAKSNITSLGASLKPKIGEKITSLKNSAQNTPKSINN